MRILLLGLFWFILSLHVVGGAVLFRRYFPKESPWFGFVLPAIAFLLVLNFIEHLVGIPSLLGLLPFTSLGAAWLLLDPKTCWRGLKLPTGIFLAALAFAILQRALKPSILGVSSGVYDLSLISSFCMGETLPPAYSWCPPYDLGQYYTFVHYSASVLTRLLDVDVGTGFNLSSALLSAWMVYLFSAIAWTVSRHRVWITIAAAVMTECAANGATAYMWLTIRHLDMTLTSCLLLAKEDPIIDQNPLMKLLTQVNIYDRRELEIPGYWSWIGSYHGTNGGQFWTLFSVWCLVEALRRRRTLWPWVGLVACPALMMITSTWGVPFVGVILLAGLGSAWCYRFRPENVRHVVAGVAVIALLLTPTLMNFLASTIYYFHDLMTQFTRTQVAEFLSWWWPIYLPWLAVLFVWKKLSPAAKIIVVLTPVFFIVVESCTFGVRIDMTGKLWGFLWGMAWSVLFPVVAMQRGRAYRLLLALLFISSANALFGWVDWTWRTLPTSQELFSLEGVGPLRTDPVKLKLLTVISTLRHQILFTGVPTWNCPECPTLANFTKNYSYIDGCFYIDNTFCPSRGEVGARRDDEVKNFYAGRLPDPLTYARTRNIAAIVIWPFDEISDEVLTKLKRQLQPGYEYEDFRAEKGPNAGVFLYHPGFETPLPAEPKVQ